MSDCTLNHGIVMYEPSRENAGIGVWQYISKMNILPALFSEVDPDSEIWSNYYVRSIGNVSIDDKGLNDDYFRYEPCCQEDFCLMCSDCLSSTHRPTLAMPANISDLEARKLLEDFWARFRGLNRRAIDGRPVASILQKRKLNADWAYVLGFYRRDEVTFFLAQERHRVAQVETYTLDNEECEIMERW